MRVSFAVAALAAISPAARGDVVPDGKRAPLADGMVLILDDGALYVERDTLRARVETTGARPEALDAVDVDRGARRVTVEITTCGANDVETLTFDVLEARLASAEGDAAAGRRAWPAAAAAYRRAALLDPEFHHAQLLAASSLVEDGDLDDAAAALAPWIAIDPVRVYAEVASLVAVMLEPGILSVHGPEAQTPYWLLPALIV